jgi:hypothetical protein
METIHVGGGTFPPFKIEVRREAHKPAPQAYHFATATTQQQGRVNPDTFSETIQPEDVPAFLKDQHAWVENFVGRAKMSFIFANGEPDDRFVQVIETGINMEPCPKPPMPKRVSVEVKNPATPNVVQRFVMEGTLEEVISRVAPGQ